MWKRVRRYATNLKEQKDIPKAIKELPVIGAQVAKPAPVAKVVDTVEWTTKTSDIQTLKKVEALLKVMAEDEIRYFLDDPQETRTTGIAKLKKKYT